MLLKLTSEERKWKHRTSHYEEKTVTEEGQKLHWENKSFIEFKENETKRKKQNKTK